MNPCGAAGTAGTLLRGLNAVQAVGNALNMGENLQRGNYGWAALDGLGLLGNLSQMSRACFAAGTPLLTPEGSKPIEQFRPGDLLLSAPEHDPTGAVEPREVEEVFTRHWRLFVLRISGREIRTTAEHPFYVEGKGWTPASLLASGDLLRSHDGRWLPLESVDDTGQDAVVYNMRIAEYHTYFVGSDEWGFSVWSHNTAYSNNPAVAEALENSVINATSKARLGIGGQFANHHIFPNAFKNWFLARGIVVDQYLVRISRTLHEALHSGQGIFGKGGWYTHEIMKALRAAEKVLPPGTRLAPDRIKEIVKGLLPGFGISIP